MIYRALKYPQLVQNKIRSFIVSPTYYYVNCLKITRVLMLIIKYIEEIYYIENMFDFSKGFCINVVVDICLFSPTQLANRHHLGCKPSSYTQSIQLKIEMPFHELHLKCERCDKLRHNRIRYFTCASNKTHSALSAPPPPP